MFEANWKQRTKTVPSLMHLILHSLQLLLIRSLHAPKISSHQIFTGQRAKKHRTDSKADDEERETEDGDDARDVELILDALVGVGDDGGCAGDAEGARGDYGEQHIKSSQSEAFEMLCGWLERH